MTLDRLVTCYVIGLSVYHVGTGTISYFAPEQALRFYRRLYGCDPAERQHLLVILRPWGALAIFAGCAGLLILGYPMARHSIEAALLLLLILRIGYRVGLRDRLRELSGIPPHRNAISILVLVAGVLLLGLDLLVNARPA